MANDKKTKAGPVSADRLKSFIERIEKLEEERKAIGGDIKDVYSEAKGVGYDVKTSAAGCVTREDLIAGGFTAREIDEHFTEAKRAARVAGWPSDGRSARLLVRQGLTGCRLRRDQAHRRSAGGHDDRHRRCCRQSTGGLLMFAAPHQAERQPLFILGRPAFDPRINLVRAQTTAWLVLVDAYSRLAETPLGHSAAAIVCRGVLRWRQRWQSGLRSLDQAPA